MRPLLCTALSVEVMFEFPFSTKSGALLCVLTGIKLCHF